MADVSIKYNFKDYNRVANKWRPFAAKMPKEMIVIIGTWAKATRAILKSTPYPAKRAGQRYVRTGNLANRWAAEQIGRGWSIVNRAKYSGYVVGQPDGTGQAWMHKGRWWKSATVIKAELPKLRREMVSEIREGMTSGL